MRHFLLACLAPWMVVTAAWGSPLKSPAAPVSIDFGSKGLISDDSVRLGDKCYATLDFLDKVGWHPTQAGLDCKIRDDGREFAIPIYSIGGHRMVCLNEVATQLGAKGYFAKNSDTFYFKANVTEVVPTANGVLIRTSLAVHPTVTATQNPPRLIIDLKGSEYDPSVGQALPPGWKLAYTTADTVRLSIDHPSFAYYRTPKISDRRTIKLALPDQVVAQSFNGQAPVTITSIEPRTEPTAATAPSGGLPDTGGPTDTSATQPTRVTNPPVTTPSRSQPRQYGSSPFGPAPTGEPNDIRPVGTTGPTATLGDVLITSDDSESLGLQIPTASLPTGSVAARYTSPNTVVVSFKGASWSKQGELGKVTNLGKEITRFYEGPNAALKITTEVPLVFSLNNSGQYATLRLTKPKGGGLSRKIIVIDPGHGGSDNGCNYGSLYEKNLTLRISTAVARLLNRAGASVIMTRDDDSYPSLTKRSELANASHADVFISIHINSVSGGAPSASMTFYHGGSNTSLLLAECIQSEIGHATRMQDWGPQNDFKRFRGSGMAVLRNANGPAVLMELGFIDNSIDRAELLATDYDDRVANAIMSGLKRFFGDRK